MANGINIKVFLIEGKFDGIVECSLNMGTSVAFKIPRTELDIAKKMQIPELGHKGIYFLFGTEEGELPLVYVGQADKRGNDNALLGRLIEHVNPKEEWWTEAVAVTMSSSSSAGELNLKYLENSFYKLAKNANRYKIMNANTPGSGGDIPRASQCDMDQFIENAKIIMGTLGHNKLFEPIPVPMAKTAGSTTAATAVLYLNRTINGVGTVTATGEWTSNGFVVYKDSQISLNTDDNIRRGIKESRNKAISDGVVQGSGPIGVLRDSMVFSSPSAAAIFVLGKSENGLRSWKNKDGKSLGDLESQG